MNYIDLLYKLKTFVRRKEIENDPSKVIDPILALIKLALLSFKPPTSKLGITDNCIYIYQPSIFQGISRGISGDTRDDLHNLLGPIYTACKLFIEGDSGYIIIPNFIELLKLAKNGITSLKLTYSDHVASKQILNIIYGILDNTILSINSDNSTYSRINYIETGIINNYSSSIYTKYSWNKTELITILNLFSLCFLEPSKKYCYIDTIECLITPIQNNIKTLL